MLIKNKNKCGVTKVELNQIFLRLFCFCLLLLLVVVVVMVVVVVVCFVFICSFFVFVFQAGKNVSFIAVLIRALNDCLWMT